MIKRTIAAILLTIFVTLALSACGAGRSASATQPDQPMATNHTHASAAPTGQPDAAATSAALPSGTQAYQVTVTGHDFTFDAPQEIPAGLITFTFKNEGAAVHHAQVVRLNDGVTFEQLMAAFAQGETAAIPLISLAGGPSLTDPGKTARVTLNLDPGGYALLCLVPDAEGIPHLAHGMARPLRITGNTATQPQPPSDLTVSMADFHYTMPGEVEAGPQTWKVMNDGPQPHELVLHKLAPGKTADDVIAFFHHPQGTPPFTHAGGMQALKSGLAGWVHLDLEPGTYIAMCYVPDPATGKRHLDLGMVKTFIVKEQY